MEHRWSGVSREREPTPGVPPWAEETSPGAAWPGKPCVGSAADRAQGRDVPGTQEHRQPLGGKAAGPHQRGILGEDSPCHKGRQQPKADLSVKSGVAQGLPCGAANLNGWNPRTGMSHGPIQGPWGARMGNSVSFRWPPC